MIYYQFKDIKNFVSTFKNFNSLINRLYDDLELKKEESIICKDSINNIIINNEEDYQNFLKNKQCHLIIDVKNKNIYLFFYIKLIFLKYYLNTNL